MPRKSDNEKPDATSQLELIHRVLDDLKAEVVVTLNVRHLTSVTDVMVIANGRSSRHVRAVAQAVAQECKDHGCPVLGTEGADGGEWVLVDLADIVVHVMLPKVRAFYELEKLWDIDSLKDAEEST
jgi:ribosome-associated protein